MHRGRLLVQDIDHEQDLRNFISLRLLPTRLSYHILGEFHEADNLFDIYILWTVCILGLTDPRISSLHFYLFASPIE